ncbi:MAG: hypothetical protein M0Q26_09895 [Chitinophagaceae bacterium]|nr:hypothetical protein [Chitinophagaceae bacterium]
MKTISCWYSLFIGMLLPVLSLAQESNTKESQKDELSASVNYQSALHYFGRTDSLKSSGLFPSVGFQSKTGLYVQGNFIFVQNASQATTYTGTTIEAGYRFPQSDHFSGNLFYSQFLYNDKSALVQSALQSQTGINLSYLNKVINLNGGIDMKFSNQTDVGATLGLDHLFLFRNGMKHSAIAINPSVYVYAGTQKFTNTYLKKKNILGFPVTQQTTEQVTQFNILSYEVSVPVVFVSGKFNASVTPSYVIPQNLVTIAGRPDLSERGKEMFYVTLSIGIKL